MNGYTHSIRYYELLHRGHSKKRPLTYGNKLKTILSFEFYIENIRMVAGVAPWIMQFTVVCGISYIHTLAVCRILSREGEDSCVCIISPVDIAEISA